MNVVIQLVVTSVLVLHCVSFLLLLYVGIACIVRRVEAQGKSIVFRAPLTFALDLICDACSSLVSDSI